MFQLVRDISKYGHALKVQFWVNIKTSTATTRLGFLWWVLDPLLLMVIYTFVIKMVFKRGGPDYHLMALCGIVTWQTFSRSVNHCTGSLVGNATLIKQAILPMHLYILIPPLVQSFFYIFGLGIIMVWNNDALGWQSPLIALILIPMILIPFSLGLFLSIFRANHKDVGLLVPYLLRFGFYFSPILYEPERIYKLNIPEIAKTLYKLNPMVHVISAVRDLLFYGRIFDPKPLIIVTIIFLILTQLGLSFFRRHSPGIPKVI